LQGRSSTDADLPQARLDGLEKDLGLVGNQYQVTLVIFCTFLGTV